MTARKFLAEARSIDFRHDDPIYLHGKREGREDSMEKGLCDYGVEAGL